MLFRSATLYVVYAPYTPCSTCVLRTYSFARQKMIGPKPVAFKMSKEFRVQTSRSFTVSGDRPVVRHFTTAPEGVNRSTHSSVLLYVFFFPTVLTRLFLCVILNSGVRRRHINSSTQILTTASFPLFVCLRFGLK